MSKILEFLANFTEGTIPRGFFLKFQRFFHQKLHIQVIQIDGAAAGGEHRSGQERGHFYGVWDFYMK